MKMSRDGLQGGKLDIVIPAAQKKTWTESLTRGIMKTINMQQVQGDYFLISKFVDIMYVL